MPRDKDYKKHQDIYNNYATPLMGTYLNLTEKPAEIRCPSCGLHEPTEVVVEMKNWARIVNSICMGVYMIFCCCWCCEFPVLAKGTDSSHYCKNCNCYLGRAKRVKPLQYVDGKRITNMYP